MSTTPLDDDLLGEIVKQRYIIEGTIGRGGMGTVYRARHIGGRRQVAIKVLHHDLVADPNMAARFEREAAITARLDHPNLVTVMEIGEMPDKRKLIVLELARGEPLSAILARGPLPRDRMIDLLGQLLRGLEHAHAAGLIHRDLKPDNIIVESCHDGRAVPRIVDFGIAALRDDDDSLADQRLTASGVILGTPQYMAPEQALGHELDPRTDLFALGVIAFEMATGKLPFDCIGIEAALANISRDMPPFAQRCATPIDPRVEAFVRRLLARRRDDRFASAGDALEALALLDTGSELEAAETAAFEPEPVEQPRRSRFTGLLNALGLRRRPATLIGHRGDRVA